MTRPQWDRPGSAVGLYVRYDARGILATQRPRAYGGWNATPLPLPKLVPNMYTKLGQILLPVPSGLFQPGHLTAQVWLHREAGYVGIIILLFSGMIGLRRRDCMYEKTKALKKQLAACWTPTQVADHFGVTPMTVFNWTEHANLPYVSLAGTMEREGAKRFVPSDVRAWAKLRAGHDFKSDKSAA